MALLLDTNVISEMRKGTRADRKVRSFIDAFEAEEFFVATVTIMKIQRGVCLLERRDPQAGEIARRWLDNTVLGVFGRSSRVLAFDQRAALLAGRWQAEIGNNGYDTTIAAIALANGMPVVARNVKDFAMFTGLTVMDPWQPG